MTTLAIAVIIVVLGLPKSKSVAALLLRCTTIRDAVAANATTFPSPSPPLAQLTTAITALTTAQTALKNHTGTREARDQAKAALVTAMGMLRAYVQQLATASPDKAADIAKAAAMTLKKPPVRTKSDLAAKAKGGGVVVVVAKATKGAKSHTWQYSTDGGKTWIDVAPTTRSNVTITGLQPGLLVQYRHRPVTKAGVGPWSDPVSAIVT